MVIGISNGFFLPWLATAGRAAIALISVQWLLSGNLLWSTVGAVCLALTFAPRVLIRDRALRRSTEACLGLFLAAHVALGMHLGWYQTSAVYDKWVHLLGSGAVTGLAIAATVRHCRRIELALPLSLLSTLALGVAISAGTLWEVFEFSLDRTGLFQAQRGLGDTMLDLVADTAGAVAAITFYAGAIRLGGLTLK